MTIYAQDEGLPLLYQEQWPLSLQFGKQSLMLPILKHTFCLPNEQDGGDSDPPVLGLCDLGKVLCTSNSTARKQELGPHFRVRTGKRE